MLVAGLVVIAVGTWLWTSLRRQKFDQDLWQREGLRTSDSQSVKSNGRSRMVDDLINNHIHVGMSRDEVLGMLGRPDEFLNSQYPYLRYYLGSRSQPLGLGNKEYELVIQFGPGDRIVELEVHQID